MTFQAKNDIRHYLNGVYISKSEFVATNGHYLGISSINEEEQPNIDEPFIVNVDIKKPIKSAKTAKFTYLSNDSGVVEFINHFGSPVGGMYRFKIVDGKFTDYQKITNRLKREKVDSIRMNAEYVNLVCKTAQFIDPKFNSTNFYINGKTDGVVAEIANREGNFTFKAVVMPMRD